MHFNTHKKARAICSTETLKWYANLIRLKLNLNYYLFSSLNKSSVICCISESYLRISVAHGLLATELLSMKINEHHIDRRTYYAHCSWKRFDTLHVYLRISNIKIKYIHLTIAKYSSMYTIKSEIEAMMTKFYTSYLNTHMCSIFT